MKREEKFTQSGNATDINDKNKVKLVRFSGCLWMRMHEFMSVFSANPSPHVKSGVFVGQMKTIWRAMTSPKFDFQGDLYQQGGAIIAGPGELTHLSLHLVWAHDP